MAQVRISPTARDDIAGILRWTLDHFGEAAARRYNSLLLQAIDDLGRDPTCPGVVARPEVAANARVFHLWHSRKRTGAAAEQVKHPRHFLLFRNVGNDCLEIGRVLHDSVDLMRHLPPGFAAAE